MYRDPKQRCIHIQMISIQLVLSHMNKTVLNVQYSLHIISCRHEKTIINPMYLLLHTCISIRSGPNINFSVFCRRRDVADNVASPSANNGESTSSSSITKSVGLCRHMISAYGTSHPHMTINICMYVYI